MQQFPNNQAKIDLITCDIDGTLLNFDGLNAPAIQELRQLIQVHNIPFTLASGRSFDGLSRVAAALKRRNFPLIGDNGAMLYKSCNEPKVLHQTLLFEPLDKATAETVANTYGANLEKLCLDGTRPEYVGQATLRLDPDTYDNNVLKIIYIYKALAFASQAHIAVSYAAEHQEHLFNVHPLWEHEYLLSDLNAAFQACDFARFSQMPIYKAFMLTTASEHEMQPIFDQFCLWLEAFKADMNVIRYGSFSLDIMPSNIDKKAGLHYLKSQTQYKHIAAIGDSLNDIGMMEVADVSACVANARPELKAVCSFVATKPYAEGVIEFLHYLLDNDLI